MSDGSKFIQAKVDEQEFEIFMSLMTRSGLLTTEFAGQLIEEAISKRLDDMNADGDTNHDLQLARIFMALRRHESRQQMLDEISSRTDDGELLDKVYEIAVVLKLDPERAQALSHNPVFTNVIESSRAGTKLGDCARWLVGLIYKYHEVAVKDIRDLSRKLGYSNETLERAKRMSMLVSIKTDGVWYWRMPDAIEIERSMDGSSKVSSRRASTVSK